ncbi:terminase small subunit [Achromobacter deleyi]|uniref:terminase small subunit n=1 Tax=Achromobacter deleyi TaxID=1353891 RepID=UPI0014926373|nr:terminase small subunit [Achromobacter deleyi]QVQ29157.1 terminase small subunit [Achromobacter deleyi]UIP19276.1 terminase small subunit [Achromobacter deleyi]
MALTDKQRRFVDEYLVDLNATQAAIRAGYSQKTAGQIGEQNFKKLEIAQAIQEAQAERSKRTEITQDIVLRELAKIGFSDIRKIVRWGKTELRVTDAGDDEDEVTEPYHGLALVSADDIDDDTAAATSEISEGREGLKVKLHDKKGALVDDPNPELGQFDCVPRRKKPAEAGCLVRFKRSAPDFSSCSLTWVLP